MNRFADKVTKLHLMHPEWCSKEIAIELGSSWGQVRSTAHRLGLVLKSGFERRKTVPWLQHIRVRD